MHSFYMNSATKYIQRTAWVFIVLSALAALLFLSGLVMSLATFGGGPTMVQTFGGALSVAALAGLFCGIGLLHKRRAARVVAIALLFLANLFWGLSLLQILSSIVESPGEYLAYLDASPLVNSSGLVISFLAVAWCSRTIFRLSRQEVKNEFYA